MIVDGDKVLYFNRLIAGCTARSTPSCGDLICEPMEKGLCDADCKNPFNENVSIISDYGNILVNITVTLPGDNCNLGLKSEEYEKSYPLMGVNLLRYTYPVNFLMNNASSGEYLLYIDCQSSKKNVAKIPYCNGCIEDGVCYEEYYSLDNKYCMHGEFLSKNSNGQSCTHSSMCISNYCSKDNICKPSFLISRWFWQIKELF
jgi:hypothetical protein